jgi:hypothetical protein
MWRHPDGQWVSGKELEQEIPFDALRAKLETPNG